MTCTEDGFSAWGKDMGGYSSNPTVAEAIEATYGHQKGGYVDGVDTFPAKDDQSGQAGARGSRVLQLRGLHRGQLDRAADQVQRGLIVRRGTLTHA